MTDRLLTSLIAFVIILIGIGCCHISRLMSEENQECLKSVCPADMKPTLDRGICRCYVAPTMRTK